MKAADREPANTNERRQDKRNEGKDEMFMDIDRMINEGLGGGNVTMDNGLIEESTTDTMDQPESYLDLDETARSKRLEK